MGCDAGLGRIFTGELTQEPILIDYNGVTCSLKLLAWHGTFSGTYFGDKKIQVGRDLEKGRFLVH